MADRDDLARLVYDAARANSPVDAFGDDPRLAKYQSIWANAAATSLLAAGWVPGELLAAEQARNATLTDTIQRVEALAEQWERWAADATKRGYPSPEEGLTFAQETHARNLRRALFGPGEEDG